MFYSQRLVPECTGEIEMTRVDLCVYFLPACGYLCYADE